MDAGAAITKALFGGFSFACYNRNIQSLPSRYLLDNMQRLIIEAILMAGGQKCLSET
jgi:hypothetical protein